MGKSIRLLKRRGGKKGVRLTNYCSSGYFLLLLLLRCFGRQKASKNLHHLFFPLGRSQLAQFNKFLFRLCFSSTKRKAESMSSNNNRSLIMASALLPTPLLTIEPSNSAKGMERERKGLIRAHRGGRREPQLPAGVRLHRLESCLTSGVREGIPPPLLSLTRTVSSPLCFPPFHCILKWDPRVESLSHTHARTRGRTRTHAPFCPGVNRLRERFVNEKEGGKGFFHPGIAVPVLFFSHCCAFCLEVAATSVKACDGGGSGSGSSSSSSSSSDNNNNNNTVMERDAMRLIKAERLREADDLR